jgi:hypothetical protein
MSTPPGRPKEGSLPLGGPSRDTNTPVDYSSLVRGWALDLRGLHGRGAAPMAHQ